MVLRRILVSLGITITVSCLVSCALWAFGLSWWKSFLLIFSLHFILFGVINYFTGIWASYRMRIIETEQLKLFSEQSAGVTCANCGEPAWVPITMGDDMTYTCDGCHKVNKVIVSAETALPTMPVSELNPDKLLLKEIKNQDREKA
jgi:hypothetical protein